MTLYIPTHVGLFRIIPMIRIYTSPATYARIDAYVRTWVPIRRGVARRKRKPPRTLFMEGEMVKMRYNPQEEFYRPSHCRVGMRLVGESSYVKRAG